MPTVFYPRGQTPPPDVIMTLAVRHVTAVRYVTPLREGGSLPAIIEADDGALYVVKFRGAGQGVRALIAEMIAAQVARAVDLPVPEPVVLLLDPALSRTEPDWEVGELLRASDGLNFGLGYLPGAITFARGADPVLDGALASRIVWFDSFVMNVDRTVRNPNLLVKDERLWLIDHGAALYWHHDWQAETDRSGDPFRLVKQHVLLPFADQVSAVSDGLASRLDEAAIDAIVAPMPDDWLTEGPLGSAAAHRRGYADFLRKRRAQAGVFVQEAIDARGV